VLDVIVVTVLVVRTGMVAFWSFCHDTNAIPVNNATIK